MRVNAPGGYTRLGFSILREPWLSTIEGGRQAGQCSSDEKGTVVPVKHELCLTNIMHYPECRIRACLVPTLSDT